MSLVYKRNTLVVADYKKALTIYCGNLGFSVNYIKESADDSYSYPVFNIPKETKATFVALDSPSQESTFALTEIKGIPLPKQTGPRMSATEIKVDDLALNISQLENLGLETLNHIKDSTDEQSNIEQAFVDYHGHLILLFKSLVIFINYKSHS